MRPPLEVGRICERLVPRLLPEPAYTGIDVSERLLAIARRRPAVGPFFRELGRVARRGFLFTVWPATEDEGVVKGRETVLAYGVRRRDGAPGVSTPRPIAIVR